jgi:phosphoglycolate phosphatase
MSLKYVLLDLDGTLTNPETGITNSIIYALNKLGIEVEDRATLHKFIGPPLIDSFMGYYGFSRDDAKKAVGLYREYYAEKGIFENEVYEGIPELLEELTQRNITCVLATSKPTFFATQVIEHFGLTKYFAYLSGTTLDDTLITKDAVITQAIKQLSITDLDNSIMVGDRKHDIEGAHANGTKCVGVLFGFGTREELVNAGADYLVETVDELRKLLISI